MNLVPGKEKKHATYSASGADRWLLCPGSTNLSKNLPDLPETKWAKEGTRGHEVFEAFNRNPRFPEKVKEFLGGRYPDEMIKHGYEAHWIVRGFLSQFPEAEFLIEERLHLPVTEPDQFGTTDVLIADHFGELIVIDYKYGAGMVCKPDSTQLIYYAVSAAHRYKYNFEKARLVILQPRFLVYGKMMRDTTMTMRELVLWRNRFEEGIQASKKKNAPLYAGDHCQFCKAKFVCPEIKNKKLRQTQLDFANAE